MVTLSYSSLNILHTCPHNWLNKQMGIPQPEKPEWEIGKKIHRIIQDHVSGKKLDPRFRHIKYTFPIVEEVDFDPRCKFEFNLDWSAAKIKKVPSGTYRMIGFTDGLNFEKKRYVEIKSADPLWSLIRFKNSEQRKIHAIAWPELEEAVLITCSKYMDKWKREPAKIYKVPLTQQDRAEALYWIVGGIRILESGNFTTDLKDGKCTDNWCYWGENCQFK